MRIHHLRHGIVGLTIVALSIVVGTTVASAHATFVDVPSALYTDTDAALTMDVPNEQGDGVWNVDVVVALPSGWQYKSCQAKPTWTCSSGQQSGRTVVHFVKDAGSGPAEDEKFAYSVHTGSQAGTFPFPTIQKYSNGEQADWIGDPGSQHPAPQLTTVPNGATTLPTTTTTSPHPVTTKPNSPTTTSGGGGGASTTVPGPAASTTTSGPSASAATTTTTSPDGTPGTNPAGADGTTPGSVKGPGGSVLGGRAGSTLALAGTSADNAAAGTTASTSSGNGPLIAAGVGLVAALGAVAAVIVLRGRVDSEPTPIGPEETTGPDAP